MLYQIHTFQPYILEVAHLFLMALYEVMLPVVIFWLYAFCETHEEQPSDQEPPPQFPQIKIRTTPASDDQLMKTRIIVGPKRETSHFNRTHTQAEAVLEKILKEHSGPLDVSIELRHPKREQWDPSKGHHLMDLIVRVWLQHGLDRVRKLELIAPEDFRPDPVTRFANTLVLRNGLPCLKQLTDFTWRGDVDNLPIPWFQLFLFPFENLKHVNLQCDISVDECLLILGFCRAVEVFQVEWLTDRPPSHTFELSSTTSLTHLMVLRISASVRVETFFKAIICKKLKELSLTLDSSSTHRPERLQLPWTNLEKLTLCCALNTSIISGIHSRMQEGEKVFLEYDS